MAMIMITEKISAKTSNESGSLSDADGHAEKYWFLLLATSMLLR